MKYLVFVVILLQVLTDARLTQVKSFADKKVNYAKRQASALRRTVAQQQAISSQDITPIFSVSLPESTYISVGFGRNNSTNAHPYLSTGDHLFPPYATTVYDMKGNVRLTNTFTTNDTDDNVSILTVAARHIEPGGPRHPPNIIVSAINFFNDMTTHTGTCRFVALDAKSKGETRPIWTYNVKNCQALYFAELDLVAMSDDGTTVAFLLLTNSSLPRYEGAPDSEDHATNITARAPSPQIHVLDVVSGRVLYAVLVPAAESAHPVLHAVSISAHGEFVYAATGVPTKGRVLDVKRRKLRVPVMDHLPSYNFEMDPTGDYISYGFDDTYVAKYDGTTYTEIFMVSGVYEDEAYAARYTAFSTNNGNPLLSIGWESLETNAIRVDMYKLDGTEIWTYVSSSDEEINVIQQMNMHYGYVIVTNWGAYYNFTGQVPQVLVFNDQSKEPVISYITRGSMMCGDIFVSRTTSSTGVTTDSVYAAAAGLNVHAILPAHGGDLFVFNKVITY